ncbi:Type I restriction modification DNA specificity domain [Yersinia frederiksenii]|nr:Type I restriction modification DNA specificity domain [Yersinia frederiksenii]
MSEQKLPEGWQMVKFGDIAKHISKRVEPSETDLEIYVGLEHLDPDSLKIKRHGVPSDVEGQKLLVKKGQIIFGKRRAYQRKVAVADWDCICSAHAIVLEANSEKVIPEFLPFFMQSDAFMNRAVAISEGSLSPTIKWKVLERQFFALPSLTSQKALLNILLATEKCIRLTEDLISSTESMLERVLREKLVGGAKKRLSDLCEIISGQHIQSSLYDNDPNGTPYLTGPDDFPDGKIILKKFTRSPKVMCRKGDVLLTVKGSGVGKCVIADGDYCISRQLMAIRSEELSSELVYLTVRAISYELNRAAAGVIPGISKAEIASFKISDAQSVNNLNMTNACSGMSLAIDHLKEKISEFNSIKSQLVRA